MKGLINVKFTIGKDFNTGDNVVTTTAKILNKDSINAYSKKDLGSISVKSKYPVKFETLQVLAAKKNMLAHLEDKGGMTFKECPAEYIRSCRACGAFAVAEPRKHSTAVGWYNGSAGRYNRRKTRN